MWVCSRALRLRCPTNVVRSCGVRCFRGDAVRKFTDLFRGNHRVYTQKAVPRARGTAFLHTDHDRLHRAMASSVVPSDRVAVMVQRPFPTALQMPPSLTVATLVLLLLHVTLPE